MGTVNCSNWKGLINTTTPTVGVGFIIMDWIHIILGKHTQQIIKYKHKLMHSINRYQIQCFRLHSVLYTPNIISKTLTSSPHQVHMSIIQPNIRDQYEDRMVQRVENILCDSAVVVLMIFVVLSYKWHETMILGECEILYF